MIPEVQKHFRNHFCIFLQFLLILRFLAVWGIFNDTILNGSAAILNPNLSNKDLYLMILKEDILWRKKVKR